jgi:hypothetical protein
MGYQKSTPVCSQHVPLHVLCLRKSPGASIEEDVSDPTMVNHSEMFIGDSKPPELTSPLKTPKGEQLCRTAEGRERPCS